MLFGEALRDLRTKADISLKQLSRLATVSPSYLSVLENEPNRVPSKEILAKLMYGLRQGDITNKNVLNGYVEIHEVLLNTDNLIESKFNELAFMNYFQQFITEKLTEKTEFLQELDTNSFENKIIFFKNGRYQTTQFPSFDLDWLLKQNQFEVFYGRKFITNPEFLKSHDDSRINYNTLTDEDKKMIREIIKVYISNKYESIPDPKEFFNKQSALSEENIRANLKKKVVARQKKFNDKTYFEILKLLEQDNKEE